MSAIWAAAIMAASIWLVVPAESSTRLGRMGLTPQDRHARGEAWVRRLKELPARIQMGPLTRRLRARRRAAAIEAVSALAAELAAGQPPGMALALAAGEPPVWPAALSAVRLNANVADALRLDGQAVPVLRSLAACWEVASASGSGLSASIDRLSVSARRAEEVRVQLEAELAAPRASARLLAGLPAFGLIIGMALGIDPVGWLLGGPLGWACVLGAVILIGAGLAWTGRIAASVERQL